LIVNDNGTLTIPIDVQAAPNRRKPVAGVDGRRQRQ
jgi:hypothetical protein